MTESIEKLIQEQKEKQRLEGELAIAQEVQAQLFPRQATELESLEVHGFCRPRSHGERRLLRLSHSQFPQADSGRSAISVGKEISARRC